MTQRSTARELLIVAAAIVFALVGVFAMMRWPESALFGVSYVIAPAAALFVLLLSGVGLVAMANLYARSSGEARRNLMDDWRKSHASAAVRSTDDSRSAP